jgi:hypothetical protein
VGKRLGSKAAAEYLGLGYSTWRGLRSRKKAPPPDGIDESFGKEYWLPSSLDKWKANRPGQGFRKDLVEKAAKALEHPETFVKRERPKRGSA